MAVCDIEICDYSISGRKTILFTIHQLFHIVKSYKHVCWSHLITSTTSGDFSAAFNEVSVS